MDAELQKLVESAKITSRQAEQLDQLRAGTYCLHKSWGFGRVAEWNLLLNQIVIDFATKKGHAMQLPYAADNLTPLPGTHFLTRKATDLPGIKQLAKSDPAAVVRNILESVGGSATVSQISEMLLGDVFNEAELKRWWDSTKKLLKTTGYFSLPTKKSEPVQLRGEAVSHADELLAFFGQARQPKDQAAALDQIIKFHHDFKDPKVQLQPVIAAVEETAAKNQKLNPALAFELVIARDDLLQRTPELHIARPEFTLAKLIQDEEQRLVNILPKLPASKERRVLQALPAALGSRWSERALRLMLENQPRLVSAIPKVFTEANQLGELRTTLERAIREHSATSEMLIWLCKDRARWTDLMTPELLGAILSAIERDQHNESRGNRLRDVLLDDRKLIPDMFEGATINAARDSMRKLMLTPVFDELTKRSLLARIIKLYPELEAMITGAQAASAEKKDESLVVSWSSLHRRKAEYEELVKKKIPDNTKEISVARSYGDLRENFEFKAAKQMQAVLMRQKVELEQHLENARGTTFENADTSQVSIGTIVTLREENTDTEETYTILGAWDGDPERSIISYKTAIGQALLGHKLGEMMQLNTDHGTGRFAIIALEAAPVDVMPPETTIGEIANTEVAVAD